VRTLLFTGKGGVGKSTLAAATACASARAGRRTLVMSADPAHSLADALDCPPSRHPDEVSDGLWLQHIDAQELFERSWGEIRSYLTVVFQAAGLESVAAEELAVVPGAEEVLALLEVRTAVRSGRWDTVVVDCAPTAETLRLLALPEALGWYIDRLLPAQRRLVGALRPVLTRAAGVPMPTAPVFDAVERLHRDLGEARDLLTGPGASVRLVLTPEQVVLAEARRAYTLLSLFGYRVDGVIANRIFPMDGADAWRTGWIRAQERVLADVDDSFAGLTHWRAPYRAGEPVGTEELLALADETYGDHDPLSGDDVAAPLDIGVEGGQTVVRLAVPLASRSDIDLARKGDDLVITVGSYRRLLTLPSGLARQRVGGASVRDGQLQVRFEQVAEATS
jgi:arsenite-transporting ATPase